MADSGCEADIQTTEQPESQDPADNSQNTEDSNQGVAESSFESNHAAITTSDRKMQDEENSINNDGNSTNENESSSESNHATVTTSDRTMQDEEKYINNDGNSTNENESSSESNHATVTTSDRKMQDEENYINNDGNSTKDNDKEMLDTGISENNKDKEGKEIDEQEERDSQVDSSKDSGVSDFSTKDYELIDGHYYYTDSSSGLRYKYDTDKEEWVETGQEESQQVTTDSEGRTYYYADGLYLCRDTEGNVFFMDEKEEWRPWEERTSNHSDKNNWYFYQGNAMFYRDKISGAVHKFNKDDNKWEKFEGNLKRKRPRKDADEEFDTDEDEGSDEESRDGTAPPGAESDPSIRFDGNTYTKVDPSDKMEYEWDADRRAWFPKVDEDFMATYQLSYGFNPDGTKNENPLKFDDDEEEKEEARLKEEEEKKLLKEKEQKNKKKATWFEMDDTLNTKVYVTNLPDSMTEEEFIALMQKCGMLMPNPHSGKPKVKLYHDKDGNFKGDALCTYIKIESVELALQILDDYEVDGRKIHVEPAKFQQKGKYDPKLKPRKKPKKELEKIQRRQEKLFDWRPDPLRGERRKHETTVILRNVFDPKEFETAMEKILDHKEAMRNQCSHFGTIKKFELYDLHPEGVVQVTFEEVESADMCVATLHKRLYCGRALTVATWDGKEKFKIVETKEEKEERLEKWNQFLESDKSSEKTSGEKKCAESKTKDK